MSDTATPAMDTTSLSDHAVMLLGFQRTSAISRQSRLAWEAGDEAPLAAEVAARRDEIIAGVLAEIHAEYVTLKSALDARGIRPTHVADIGCGTGINNVYLARDFAPAFTLIDIEETAEQYHEFRAEGSGYASLAAARALLEANGVAPAQITTINPTKTPDAVNTIRADFAISAISCGFHYPVDDYETLFAATLERGGSVCFDVRRKYLKKRPAPLARLLDAAEVHEVAEANRSFRLLLVGGK